MFVKTGNAAKGKGTAISKAFTQMAREISTVLSPASAPDARSKSYKQLSELHNLKSLGILTEEEYLAEKSAVMANLKLL